VRRGPVVIRVAETDGLFKPAIACQSFCAKEANIQGGK
jgi:hypothetical protein